VFEAQRQRAALVAYSLPFGGEGRRPPNVVLDEADDARLKTEGVGHCEGLTRRNPGSPRGPGGRMRRHES
jgi:hypothetical protein